jgi:hypothetical protein
MLGRLIKRLLHRLIRGLIRARLALLVVIVLLVAALALGGFQAVQLPALGFSFPGPKRAPDATENYMKGLQSYNAELICNSLSDEVLDRLRARAGTCLEVQQRQLDLSRERGSRLEQVNYIGGYGLPDGTAYQFYVVASRGPMTRSEVEYVTYIFTLDRSGKISKVQ